MDGPEATVDGGAMLENVAIRIQSHTCSLGAAEMKRKKCDPICIVDFRYLGILTGAKPPMKGGGQFPKSGRSQQIEHRTVKEIGNLGRPTAGESGLTVKNHKYPAGPSRIYCELRLPGNSRA